MVRRRDLGAPKPLTTYCSGKTWEQAHSDILWKRRSQYFLEDTHLRIHWLDDTPLDHMGIATSELASNPLLIR
jgi:hypothetical protein